MTAIDNDSETPQINDTGGPQKVSKGIVFFTIFLSVIGVCLGYVSAVIAGIGSNGRIGELFGHSIGVIVFGLIIVAFFQLFKRYRNQSSRWKIYCWSVIILSLISIGNLIQGIAPVAI